MRLILLLAATALATPTLAATPLTLHRVMLSAAGVGYFEYTAQASGPATLGLDIPLSQVDDVLRSLAVFDDHGGVGSIELPGQDDSHQAFSDVPFTAQTLDSPALLLASLRGESLSVSGPQAMQGRIVSVVQEPLQSPTPAADAQPATRTRVTLLTPDGLRQFILEQAASVQLADPMLRTRVGAALDAARQQAQSTSRHLTLRSEPGRTEPAAGQGAPGPRTISPRTIGPRTIGVGYVVAAPLWKASYRLVLPAAGTKTARIQGWAVLENQSGTDWKGVDLTLHAGNPVTFHQAIYASYYADRPDVPVDVLTRILPDVDQRALANQMDRPMQRRFRGAASPPPPPPPDMPPPPPQDFVPPPIMAAQSAMKANAPAMAAPDTETAAAETAIDTSFHIASPVDLARGHTASVPILDQAIPAQPLDWLQATATRPVSAIRITNDGAASLPPGALTLYTDKPAQGAAFASGPSFAGDARLSGLPAGETRLLAFAEDLRTTATRTADATPDLLQHVTVANGVMHRTIRHRTKTTVTLTGPARAPRHVLIDFAKTPGATFQLDDGTHASEETASAWRVAIDLQPNQTRAITADTDTAEVTEDAILQDDGTLNTTPLLYVSDDRGIDAALREKLAPLYALRDTTADRQATLAALSEEQTATESDEQRTRANLTAVIGPGDFHDRLIAALDATESKLAALHTKITAARVALDASRKALADAVRALAI